MVARRFSLNPPITRSAAICWRNFAANSDATRYERTRVPVLNPWSTDKQGIEAASNPLSATEHSVIDSAMQIRLFRKIETDELRPTARIIPSHLFPAGDHNRGYLLFA